MTCKACGNILKGKNGKFCNKACESKYTRKSSWDNPCIYYNRARGRYMAQWRDENNKKHVTMRARWVWEKTHGSIPEDKLYVIHHKDENKENDDPENLELMELVDHTVYHDALNIFESVERSNKNDPTRERKVEENWGGIADRE